MQQRIDSLATPRSQGDFMGRIASNKLTRKIRTAYRDTVLAGRMIVEPPSGTVHPDAYGKLFELRDRLVEVLGFSPTNRMQQKLLRDSLTSAATDPSNDFASHADRLLLNLQIGL
jgi:hypothetical protein